jgi:hypothetical protein
MSKNIDQIYATNPITSNASTDLMYFGQSPYGPGDDAAMTYSNFNAQFATTYLALAGGTMTGALNMGSNEINNLGTPVSGSDAATKSYVDAIATGGGAPVYAATTVALTVTQAGAGVGATLTNAGSQATFALDGTTPPLNSRILVKNQATNTQNGVYTLTNVGSGSTNWVLTRAADYDTTADINGTGIIPVTNGTVNAGSGWVNTTLMVTVDTTAITFVQFGLPLPVALTDGGTNATLTASNGGIFYSTASAGAILAGTATANLPLLSGSTAAPSWGAFAISLGGALTTGGSVTFSGAHTFTGTLTANTSVTFPTSGTLATTSGSVVTVDADSGSATPSSGIITISGGSTGLTTSGSAATINLTGTLALANGGTNANLTASNGGIFYSTGSAGAILSGTATAHQILLSGASTTPLWSTSTYPTTNAINTILYASSANTMAALSTADSGVLVTSSTGVPSILAGGTTAQVLQASTSGTPAWSTATYPATTTINQLLYSSSANTVAGLATSATAVLTTSSSVPTWATELSLALGGTNANLTASNGGIFYSTSSAGAILSGTATAGQLLTSGASASPAWTTSTYPATNAANTLLYASSANVMAALSTANSSILTTNGSGVPSWTTSLPSGLAPFVTVDQTTSSVTMAVNTQYVTDDGSNLVTYTLPATAAQGSIFRVMGLASGGWKIGQASGQTCHVGSSATTSGTGGSIASTNQYDQIELVCVTANTTFVAFSLVGNLTIV